jgi:hypothetical protein
MLYRIKGVMVFTLLSLSILSVLCLSASAGPAPSLCNLSTSRGTVPSSFPLDACVEGKGVHLENNLDIPVGVDWQGGFGPLQVLASDETIEAQVAQFLAHKDESQLLPPGDKVFRQLDDEPATVTVQPDPAAAMNYLLANRITTILGNDLLEGLDNAVPLVADQTKVYTRYHNCAVKAKKSKAKQARCSSKLKTDVAASAKLDGVRLNKRTINRLVAVFKAWKGDQMVKAPLRALSQADRVLLLGKATNTAPVITSVIGPDNPASSFVKTTISYRDPECDVVTYQNFPEGAFNTQFFPIDISNGTSTVCSEGSGQFTALGRCFLAGTTVWYARLRDAQGNLSQQITYLFICR